MSRELTVKKYPFSLYIYPEINFIYEITASLLSKKLQDPVDSVILSVGVQTVLQQFDELQLMNYISYISDYIVSFTTPDR